MRFGSSILAAVAAFASSAVAQTAGFDVVSQPGNNQVLQAGSTFPITWAVPAQYTGETVQISLIGGKTQKTQVPLQDIASGVANAAGSYQWAIPADLGDDAVYGLVIKLESNPKIFQYSYPFQIKKGSTSSSGGVTTTTLTTQIGVKTVTISRCSTSTSTSTTSTTSTTTTPTVTPTPTIRTPTYTPTPTIKPCDTTIIRSTLSAAVTSVVTVAPPPPVSGVAPPPPAQTTTPPAVTVTPPASGAAQVGAPLAIIGAIAMALFTL